MNWIAFALVGAFFLGLQEILKKKILKNEGSLGFLTILYIANFLLVLPFVFRVNFDLSINLIGLIFFRSILMFVAMFSFTEALKYLPISVVAPLSNLKTLFALFFGLFFLNELVGVIQILGIIIILIGSYILDLEKNIKNYRKSLQKLIKSRHIHYILIFSAFYSLSAVVSKIILRDIDSISLIFHHSFLSVIIYLLIVFIFRQGIVTLKRGWSLAGLWIALIALLGLVATYTKFLALASVASKVALVIPVIQLSTLIEVVFGGRLFHEDRILIRAAGCALMVFGTILIFI